MPRNDTIRTCYCGKAFRASSFPCYARAGRGKFCSRQCSGKASSKLSSSDITEITHLSKTMRTPAIAKQFLVSATTIRKILRKHGLSRGKAHPGAENGMYGQRHTEEAKHKMHLANKRQFMSEESRKQAALRTCAQIAAGKTGKAFNHLEQQVAEILATKKTQFVQQFPLGRHVFDFCIPDQRVLIEAHGTFWHADPRFYDPSKLSPIQRRNVANDLLKAKTAKTFGYELRVMWEADVVLAIEGGVA